MTATIHSLAAHRPCRQAQAFAARQNAKQVCCPYCGALPGRPCVNRSTVQARPEGPHRGRLAAAEAELERSQDA
ncbi:zinc finger domain-containing protein [Nocardia sp. NBC_00565]|uniref:zinc finger domain-containing protein n=1 Tax=Nocardia sp. NBC_00565 TaxID=2975993 RepID=UPI003FA55831